IVGDRAPRLRPQGIGLLRDAVTKGGAEAAERLAVLVAAGADGAPDWRAALQLLGLGAERGWASARSQLEVLASMVDGQSSGARSGRPPPAAAARVASWLSEEAHLKQLFVPGPGSMLCTDPQIGLFPAFVSAAVCDWLVERARGRLERARVYDAFKHTD